MEIADWLKEELGCPETNNKNVNIIFFQKLCKFQQLPSTLYKNNVARRCSYIEIEETVRNLRLAIKQSDTKL